MLTSDHPLVSLQAEAALGSPWPTLHFLCSSEVDLVAASRRLAEVVGPTPQADHIEPWDPEDAEDPWELRVALPGLGWDSWVRLQGSLPDAVLVPGPGPAQRACDDLGHRQVEVVGGGGLEAELCFDAEHGGVLTPALRPVGASPGLEELERELAAAVASASAELEFLSERGEGRLQPVVARTTGRRGVQLTIPDALLDPLPGDQLLRLRRDLVAAVGGVVRRRSAPGGRLRLAPDLVWDTRLGLTLTLWLLEAHDQPLPGDATLPDGLSCAPVEGLDGLVESLEVQVVPSSAGEHDRVVAEVVATAQQLGAALVGGAPRWLRRGAGWAFCPVWVAPVDGRAADTARVLAALPGVAAVRVAPAEPTGLGEVWHQSDPAWYPGAHRWLLRARDGLTDRDRLERIEPREPTARDLEVELAVARIALAEATGAPLVARPALCRPVRGSRGREGVELLVGGEEGSHEPLLRAALDALCRVEHPELCSLGTCAFREDGVHVHLWFRGGDAEGRPAWG